MFSKNLHSTGSRLVRLTLNCNSSKVIIDIAINKRTTTTVVEIGYLKESGQKVQSALRGDDSVVAVD
jgi:hypothetical protein